MDNILEKIYKSGLLFLVPMTLDETYSLIVQEAIKLVKADHGSIFIMKGGDLKRVSASDLIFYRIIPRKKGITYKVFKTGQPQLLSSAQIKRIHPELIAARINSDMVVPLSYRNKSFGVLSVMSKKEDFFTADDLNVLKLFSPLASLAIKKTELYNETKIALDSRDLFISMAAHELRTPLTSIHGYIQLLRNKMANLDTSEARWVEQLYGESVRMTNLVSELLEINRIKTGNLQYNWQECDLREIIKRVLSNFKLSYSDRLILFRDLLEGGQVMVVGDYDKIFQVITNLVDNGIKFSPADSKIEITLARRNNQLVFCIKDHGIGIDRKDVKKIFEGFYQGSNGGIEGMGLGLFIVKDIINKHHGTIKVQSRLNKGTTVEVNLPGVKYADKIKGLGPN